METYLCQEETHNNFSDEFTSEVSIHLPLVFQFWHSAWQMVDSFFQWRLKLVPTCLGTVDK